MPRKKKVVNPNDLLMEIKTVAARLPNSIPDTPSYRPVYGDLKDLKKVTNALLELCLAEVMDY